MPVPVHDNITRFGRGLFWSIFALALLIAGFGMYNLIEFYFRYHHNIAHPELYGEIYDEGYSFVNFLSLFYALYLLLFTPGLLAVQQTASRQNMVKNPCLYVCHTPGIAPGTNNPPYHPDGELTFWPTISPKTKSLHPAFLGRMKRLSCIGDCRVSYLHGTERICSLCSSR